jgi:hypothetical protein
MTRSYFFIHFLLLCFFIYAEEEPESIKISLSSPQEITNALFEIQKNDPESFNALMTLKEKSDPSFLSRLHNRLYALKHKEMLEKKIPIRPLGYYEKTKHSNTKIKELRDIFQKTSDEKEKIEIEKKLEEVATERFMIELDFRKLQTEREENLLNIQKQRLAEFEKSKDTYIQRLVTKAKSS